MNMLDWRGWLHHLLAIGGLLVIIAQALYLSIDLATRDADPSATGIRMHVAVTLLGIFLNQIGVWRLAHHLFPDRRVYLKLRAEVDHFVDLARELNASSLEGRVDDVSRVRERMIRSVDRLVDAAGIAEENPATARPRLGAVEAERGGP